MKTTYISTLLAIGLSFTATGLSGQDFIELFKTQDYEELSITLSEDVNLKMDDGSKVNGSKAVLSALKKRLGNFTPTTVETKHKGSSDARKTDYLIAKLFNAEGEGMRIFIHLENSPNGKKICDIKLRDL